MFLRELALTRAPVLPQATYDDTAGGIGAALIVGCPDLRGFQGTEGALSS